MAFAIEALTTEWMVEEIANTPAFQRQQIFIVPLAGFKQI
jgi:hypothetical protein